DSSERTEISPFSRPHSLSSHSQVLPMHPQSRYFLHPLFSVRLALVAMLVMAGGGSAMAWFYHQEPRQPKEIPATVPSDSAEELITLPRSTWKAARVELGSPERRQLSHTVR